VSRVAIATARGVEDPDNPALLGALAEIGVAADVLIWDDPSVRWDDYDLTVLRSTWDYSLRREEFLTWARTVARLENPYAAVEFSSDKIYLADIESRGVDIIPSHFCAVGERPEYFAGDFVVKPRIGAGSRDAVRYHEGDEDAATHHVQGLHAQGRDVIVQPYVHSVDTLGERAVIFIDDEYSHAITKGAMLNVAPEQRDFMFRRQQVSSVAPERDAIETAAGVLDTLGLDELLYARVDLVATTSGWLVMELELVEPCLFLTFDDRAPARLAAGIAARID
jgi:glutathione synthase/RimK-type ligase-like ATP-grasp enzyme